MTNRIAFALAGLLALAVAVDALWFGGTVPLLLARKLAEFVEFLAFWR